MTCPTIEERLNAELDQLKSEGKTFSPANLAKKFNCDPHGVINKIRDRPDIYQIEKCKAIRSGLPYKSSVWGFREVPA